MKILKISGLVVAAHVILFVLLLTIPACSSTSKPAPAATETIAKADPAPPPVVAVPPAASGPETPVISAAPPAPAPETPPVGVVFYSPTRPNTAAASALETQPVADVTPTSTYTVGKGDSLWTIAKKNHLKVSELAAANNLKSGSTIRPGQKLLIPASAAAPAAAALNGGAASGAAVPAASAAAKMPSEETKYTVHANETLGAIARKFHVRVADLATRNNISDPQKIRPGQELIIPAGGHSTAKRTPKSAAGAPKPDAAAAAAASPSAPAADQDLDAGAAPGASADVPVIKISGGSDSAGASGSPAPSK